MKGKEKVCCIKFIQINKKIEISNIKPKIDKILGFII